MFSSDLGCVIWIRPTGGTILSSRTVVQKIVIRFVGPMLTFGEQYRSWCFIDPMLYLLFSVVDYGYGST